MYECVRKIEYLLFEILRNFIIYLFYSLIHVVKRSLSVG